MNASLWKLSLFLVAVGAVVLVGCSDDDVSCGDVPVLSIRDGSWREATVISESGTNLEFCFDSTVVNVDTTVVYSETDTLIFCDLFPAGSSSSVCCDDVTIDGNQIDFSCSLVFPFANPCEVRVEITGSGTFSETSYNLNIRCMELPVAGPANPCDVYTLDGYGDTCIVEFERVGTWLSSEGDSLCTSGNAVIQGESFAEGLINRMGLGRRRP